MIHYKLNDYINQFIIIMNISKRDWSPERISFMFTVQEEYNHQVHRGLWHRDQTTHHQTQGNSRTRRQKLSILVLIIRRDQSKTLNLSRAESNRIRPPVNYHLIVETEDLIGVGYTVNSSIVTCPLFSSLLIYIFQGSRISRSSVALFQFGNERVG